MAEVFANSENPDQTPRSAASDLGLHCLPITLLGVSRQHGLTLCMQGKISADYILKNIFLF